MALPPQKISAHYSFIFTGEELQVYSTFNNGSNEALSFNPGDYFAWHDEGNYYQLTLKEVSIDNELGAQRENEAGLPGPSANKGRFELSDAHSQNTREVIISA